MSPFQQGVEFAEVLVLKKEIQINTSRTSKTEQIGDGRWQKGNNTNLTDKVQVKISL